MSLLLPCPPHWIRQSQLDKTVFALRRSPFLDRRDVDARDGQLIVDCRRNNYACGWGILLLHAHAQEARELWKETSLITDRSERKDVITIRHEIKLGLVRDHKHCTEWMGWMSHRKRREPKQQPSCAWLLLSFFPFPVRRPFHSLCT